MFFWNFSGLVRTMETLHIDTLVICSCIEDGGVKNLTLPAASKHAQWANKQRNKTILHYTNRFTQQTSRVSWQSDGQRNGRMNASCWSFGCKTNLLGWLKHGKLQHFRHIVRKSTYLKQDILEGMTPESRARGRLKKNWMNNVTSWTEMECPRKARGVRKGEARGSRPPMAAW